MYPILKLRSFDSHPRLVCRSLIKNEERTLCTACLGDIITVKSGIEKTRNGMLNAERNLIETVNQFNQLTFSSCSRIN